MKRFTNWLTRNDRSIRRIYRVYFVLIFTLLSLIMSAMIFILKINAFLGILIPSPTVTMFVIMISSLLISAFLSYYVMRELFRVLEQLSTATRQVAKGDYSIQLESADIPIEEVQQVVDNFNQMTRELNSVEMLRNDFIANVSHEFKTPLSSISGYITLLQDPDLTEEERNEYIRMAIYNTDRLNTLTENILRLSRLENQSNLPPNTSYRLDEQMREAIVMLERKWSEKEILLDIDLQEVQYFGCRELLLQVWTNLIGNAIKFSPQCGQIHIQLTQVTGAVHAVIRDWGIGMDEETQAHIFDKFYQGDTSRRGQGNGLGLALSKKIIDLCGGEIFVSSQPGQGSVFTVILPTS